MRTIQPFIFAGIPSAVLMPIVCVGLLAAAGCATSNKVERISLTPAFCPVVGDEAVTQLLKPIRQKFNLPAMAVAVVTSDGIKYVGAVGVRKRGTEVPVGLDDVWHLGSDAKIMTATLIAKLIEQGRLRWDSTLGEIFPDFASHMNPKFRNVTLLELLSHRSGLPRDAKWNDYRGKDGEEERLRIVREELARTPLYKPGSKFGYSNIGFVIAGAVVEKSAGESWENAIANEVFKPLQMETAGFGGTGTLGQIDQPWPHYADGAPAPENGLAMDNPPVLDPAGRVHCSIQDWTRFVQDQLRGACGEQGTLLQLASYQELQTPAFGDNPAPGWGVGKWHGGKALAHQGSNGMNYANVLVAPELNWAILVCVNQGGDSAFKATGEAMGAMVGLMEKQSK